MSRVYFTVLAPGPLDGYFPASSTPDRWLAHAIYRSVRNQEGLAVRSDSPSTRGGITGRPVPPTGRGGRRRERAKCAGCLSLGLWWRRGAGCASGVQFAFSGSFLEAGMTVRNTPVGGTLMGSRSRSSHRASRWLCSVLAHEQHVTSFVMALQDSQNHA